MSATNATAVYGLPLFIGSDKPAWLTDWNGAMNAIDTAIAAAKSAADGAGSDVSALTLTVTTLSGTVDSQGTTIGTLSTAVTTNTGSINTITALIGNGEPTTSDKTIIGAINEIYAMITGGGGAEEIAAANVTYDNTTSGMTADDVQEAIDELHAAIQPAASTEEKVTGTLAAGSTSITLTTTAQHIAATTLVLPFTSEFGVNPTNISISGDAVTLTFESQAANVTVGILVKN